MTKGNGLPCARCGTSEWFANGKCKVCHREHGRTWMLSNPKKEAERKRRWEQNNQDKKAESNRRWAQANPDYQHRYQQANPDKVAANDNRRRTRKTQAGGSYTPAEWKDLCNHYGNRCLRCKRTGVKLTADHIKPVSKGGTSNIENIQPLCSKCNSGKKDRHIDYRPDAGPLRWLQAKLFG